MTSHLARVAAGLLIFAGCAHAQPPPMQPVTNLYQEFHLGLRVGTANTNSRAGELRRDAATGALLYHTGAGWVSLSDEASLAFFAWLSTNTYVKTETDPALVAWLSTNTYVKAETDPVASAQLPGIQSSLSALSSGLAAETSQRVGADAQLSSQISALSATAVTASNLANLAYNTATNTAPAHTYEKAWQPLFMPWGSFNEPSNAVAINRTSSRIDIRSADRSRAVLMLTQWGNGQSWIDQVAGLETYLYNTTNLLSTSPFPEGARGTYIGGGLHAADAAILQWRMTGRATGTNNWSHDAVLETPRPNPAAPSIFGGYFEALRATSGGDLIVSNTIRAGAFAGGGAGITGIVPNAAMSNSFYLASNPSGYVSSAAGWSGYPATQNVLATGFSISDLNQLSATGTVTLVNNHAFETDSARSVKTYLRQQDLQPFYMRRFSGSNVQFSIRSVGPSSVNSEWAFLFLNPVEFASGNAANLTNFPATLATEAKLVASSNTLFAQSLAIGAGATSLTLQAWATASNNNAAGWSGYMATGIVNMAGNHIHAVGTVAGETGFEIAFEDGIISGVNWQFMAPPNIPGYATSTQLNLVGVTATSALTVANAAYPIAGFATGVAAEVNSTLTTNIPHWATIAATQTVELGNNTIRAGILRLETNAFNATATQTIQMWTDEVFFIRAAGSPLKFYHAGNFSPSTYVTLNESTNFARVIVGKPDATTSGSFRDIRREAGGTSVWINAGTTNWIKINGLWNDFN